jgi:thymidylate synthase ThyX
MVFSSIFQAMTKRRVYLLSPRDLSPETIAVAFAKTSRSPESFREIASGLNDASSAKFNERWVVGYGHASVAEHAVLHIAIENVSRLAVECIESNRLASYTEKSTRYQTWSLDDFTIPSELNDHPLKATFARTCNLLFEVYAQCLIPVRKMVESGNPRGENEPVPAYDRRIRSAYVDSCRFLLPAASLANLGMTANARILEHAICKMLSHPLAEVREVGEEIKASALEEVPTLVKYATPLPYLIETRAEFSKNLTGMHEESMVKSPALISGWCQLIDFDPEGEKKILAAAMYRFGDLPYSRTLEKVRSASPAELDRLSESLLDHMSEHDVPLRELEYSTYTFDLILDQGGYAEFKRHRMMTQTPQMLTTRLGYEVPRLIVKAGIEKQYRNAMDLAARTYEELANWNPQVASYIVPNGFNRRVLFSMNLREAFAFCQLRSASNAHFSMRRVAHRVAEEIRHVHPFLSKFMHLTKDTWQDIEKQNL